MRTTGDGQLEVSAPGMPTLHGISNREPVSARANVTAPVSVAGILKVKDELTGAFNIVARR